jgi:hypothetical protein
LDRGENGTLMKIDDLDGLDAEYAADAGLPEAHPVLSSYFGDEAPDRRAVLAAQIDLIAGWLSRAGTLAIVRREIKLRRSEAFAAEGFA